MDPQYQLERAMDRLEEAFNRGEITDEEYWAEMRELQAEYRDSAREAAEAEYERWF